MFCLTFVHKGELFVCETLPEYGIKSYVKNFVVYFQIARLQDRITIVQQHMASEQCSGGPHCMLQDGMFVPPFLDPAAQVFKHFFNINIAGF